MKKPQTCWMIKAPGDSFYLNYCGATKKIAIKKWLESEWRSYDDWEPYEISGFRCVKLELHEAKK